MKRTADRLRVMVVDKRKEMLKLFSRALDLSGARLMTEVDLDLILCRNGEEAVKAVENDPCAVIFLRLDPKANSDIIRAGERIRKRDKNVNFVLITGGSPEVEYSKISKRILPADRLMYVKEISSVQEIRQFVFTLSAKWEAEFLLDRMRMELVQKVGELEKNGEELLINKVELENVNTQLMETNNALSVLARNLDKTKKESEKRILQRTRNYIVPIIDKLRLDQRLSRYKVDLDLLDEYINSLTSDITESVKVMDALTSSQVRIASMIRNGMTSEEIAKHLFISLSTVKTHRKNIRQKLNLNNSKVNLQTYLESIIN
jgi:DNA-binding NarL/FixJ family response regulator